MIEFPILFDGIVGFIMLIIIGILVASPKIPNIPLTISVLVAVVAILLLGFAPATEAVGTDREIYASMFNNSETLLIQGFRDMGFIYYAYFCNYLSGSVTVAFLISAFVYVISYLYFTQKISHHKGFYLFLLCLLSLGFTNHHYNVLRAGLAIAFTMLAIAKNQRLLASIILFGIAISFHNSAVLIILGYLVTSKIRSARLLYLFWVVIFIGLLAGVFDSFDQYYSLIVSSGEERLDYLISDRGGEYKTGLRLDFILYSLIPILAGSYYIYIRKYTDEYYIHLYNTYLFCNGCWLVVSKMPFNDRMVYLSWFLIPIILLYPILNDYNSQIKNKRLLMIASFVLVAGINLTLKYLQ